MDGVGPPGWGSGVVRGYPGWGCLSLCIVFDILEVVLGTAVLGGALARLAPAAPKVATSELVKSSIETSIHADAQPMQMQKCSEAHDCQHLDGCSQLQMQRGLQL